MNSRLCHRRSKFTQHENLRSLLLSTRDAKLIEHTANDTYWGDGGDGSGKNRLERNLMEVREQLAVPRLTSDEARKSRR